MKEFLIVYCSVVLGMSLIAFIAYGADKKKAQAGAWRTKECVLLALGVLGGATGALLGMKLFRHKTKRWYFWAVNFTAFAVQVALPIAVVILLF